MPFAQGRTYFKGTPGGLRELRCGYVMQTERPAPRLSHIGIGSYGSLQLFEVRRTAGSRHLVPCDRQIFRYVDVDGGKAFAAEAFERSNPALPHGDVLALLHLQPLLIPIARQRHIASEHGAHVRMINSLSFPLAMSHDVQ